MLALDFQRASKHLAVMMILAILTVSLAALPPPGPDCFDELMLLWNAFATDANRYMQTSEANEEKRKSRREKIRKEWEAVNRCECF